MTSPKILISYDEETNSFKFYEEVLNEMNSSLSAKAEREGLIDLPIAIISIVGDYRKGKSFLLNWLLRYLQRPNQTDWIGASKDKLEGFNWNHGCERVTNGIVIWPEPFIIERLDGKKIAVILMDTQGLNDDTTPKEIVEQIFNISTLISSVQIYNQLKQIQTNYLDTLARFHEFGRSVYKDTEFKIFQKLVFLIRDWRSPNEYTFGLEGGRSYLKNKRRNQKNFAEQWRMLDDCYSAIDCFLMPAPGERCFETEFQGQIAGLKPEFIEHLQNFVPAILSPENIVTKSMYGDELGIMEFSSLISKISSQLKAHNRINVDEISLTFMDVKLDHALREATELFLRLTLKDLTNDANQDNKKIDEVFKRCRVQALVRFEMLTKFIGEIKYQKEAQLIQFFDGFEKEYINNNKLDNRSKERWETALKWAGKTALFVGWTVVLGRFRVAGWGFRLLKLLLTRS